MILRTSYYANMRTIMKVRNTKFIGISQSHPKWLPDIPTYKPLCPPWEIVAAIRANEIDENEYTKLYIKNTLNKLDPIKVLNDLKSLANNNNDITILCYETINDFCHRRIAGEFLFHNNLCIKEFIKG